MAVEISPELQVQLDHIQSLATDGGISVYLCQKLATSVSDTFQVNEDTYRFILDQSVDWYLGSVEPLSNLLEYYQVPVSEESIKALLQQNLLLSKDGVPSHRYGESIRTGTFTTDQVWKKNLFVELMGKIGVTVTEPSPPASSRPNSRPNHRPLFT